MEAPLQPSLEDLPLVVESEDGETYHLDLYRPRVDDVVNLWEHVKKFRVLFSDNVQYDLPQFTQFVMQATTVIMTVDDVGVVYLTDVNANGTAEAHFIFWDRRIAGRHKVILSAFQWMMDLLEIQRLNISIPVYAFSALKRAKKLGLRLEGVRRKARLFEGKWHDEFLFGVLREEGTPEALAVGKLERTKEEDSWYGVLDNDNALLTKIRTWSNL